MGIGSYLDDLHGFRGTIWGSGAMNRSSKPDLSGCDVLALRGQLTKNHSGSHCSVLGDPGLLAGVLVKDKIPVNHEVGLIRHWNDKETTVEDAYNIKVTNDV
jgi:hypothetical protein